MYDTFMATAYKIGSDDQCKPVTVWPGTAENEEHINMSIHPIGPCVIHITKEQAMKFFGLVDPTEYRGVSEILTEASSIINGDLPKREPIVDELQGFSLMFKGK